MKQINLAHLSFTLSLLVSPLALAQNATTNEWTGTDSGDWNTATNWSRGLLPSTGDNVGISADSPAISTSAPAASDLTQLLLVSNTFDLNHTLGMAGTLFIAGAPATQPTGGLYLGAQGNTDTSILNINDGGVLILTDGNFRIGRSNNSATLNLAEGGEIVTTSRGIDIGRDNLSDSTLNQTGGTITQTENNGSDFKVGAFGGKGTYNMSGGTADIRNLRVHFAQNINASLGEGIVNQSGGVINSGGGIAIGWSNRGDATYNLSGGILTSDLALRMGVGTNGEDTPEHTTTNRFIQTGGSVFVTRADIGERPPHKNSYDISSGTFETVQALRIGALNSGAQGEMTISGDAEVTINNNLALGPIDNTTGILNLNGGVLNASQILAGATNPIPQILNLNGGTIKALINTGNLIQGGTSLRPILHENGVTIDSNGFAVSVGAITGSGPITKIGENTLSFRLPSTFIGDVIVNEGSVSVTAAGGLTFKPEASGVTNQITGNGSGFFSFIGTMTIDLSDAAAVGSWTLIDTDNLAGNTFGEIFSIADWNDEGDNTWTRTFNGTDFLFEEATGTLTAGAGASAFDLWASNAGLTAENNGLDDDPDLDGTPNILEFVTGHSPLAFDSSIFNSAFLSEDSYDIEFNRSDASEAVTGLVLQYGSDLVGWTDILIGAETSADVTVEEDDTSLDTISISLDHPLAVEGKLFVRLLTN